MNLEILNNSSNIKAKTYLTTFNALLKTNLISPRDLNKIPCNLS